MLKTVSEDAIASELVEADSPLAAQPGNFSFCRHCGEGIVGRPIYLDGTENERAPGFCCRSCAVVWKLLQQLGPGLENPSVKARELRQKNEKFEWIDEPEFRTQFAIDPERPDMEFFIEGIQCTACLWTLEHLKDWYPDVESSRFSVAQGTLRLRLNAGGRFGPILHFLASLSYQPSPVTHSRKLQELQMREVRKELVRIGIAAFSAGNIMLLAVSGYGGLEGALARGFLWLSAILFLPVLLFSAWPFFLSARGALITRQISIDVPVALTLIFGSTFSFFELWNGGDRVYFDSLSVFVFFLLSSRFLLKRIQSRSVSGGELHRHLFPIYFLRWEESLQKWRKVPAASLSPGDRALVLPDGIFPADGKIVRGETFVNRSFLTGESRLEQVGPGSLVFGGTINRSDKVEIEVLSTAQDSRIGQIIAQVETNLQKSPWIELSDRASRFFLGLLLVLVSGVGAWDLYTFGLEIALPRAMALLIIACPCVLALATPLVLGMVLSTAGRKGILIKSAQALERLASIRTLFLDKTGTLTHGDFQVQYLKTADSTQLDDQLFWEQVFALEYPARHPVGKALLHTAEQRLSAFSGAGPSGERYRSIVQKHLIDTASWKELPHWGVCLQVGDQLIALHRRASDGVERGEAGTVQFTVDGKLTAEFLVSDSVRPEARSFVQQLKARGIEPILLSGDEWQACASVARTLGIEQVFAECSPEEKQRYIRRVEKAGMVGDGANDALALASASVGIAIKGSLELSLRSADVVFQAPGLAPVLQAIDFSRGARKILLGTYLFSILYNLIGVGAVLSGWVQPLLAAVLMPLSATSVFMSAWIGAELLSRKEIQCRS